MKSPVEGVDAATDIIGRSAPGAGHRVVITWNEGTLVRDLPEEGELSIGRGEGADVRIESTSVSRRHALLRASGGRFTVEDLKSANGTYVDGVLVPPGARMPVPIGSLVELGSVLLVVRGYGASAGSEGDGIVRTTDTDLRDPETLRMHQLAELVARGKLSVLIIGETGTGKGRLAELLHARSARAEAPFVKVACGLDEPSLDVLLFGDVARAGAFERASGGTLFLDEVGDLPPPVQTKLLHVLESGQVTRGGEPKGVDVRIVCSTAHELKERLATGTFRSDLFFRLDGFTIRIPPLRARTLDVVPLATRFAEEVCLREARSPIRFAEGAINRLVHHPWPGNVRELEHAVERSVVLCDRDVLEGDDLLLDDPSLAAEAGAVTADERQRITLALEESAGNQTRAAKLLGISRRTLVNRLSALDLPRPRKKL